MTKPGREVILEAGQACRLVALKLHGGAPALEYLEELDAAAQAAFKGRFEHLCAQGWLRAPEYMRLLATDEKPPKVWEIKVDKGPGHRLYVVRHGVDWAATHGGIKPKPKLVRAEVTRARAFFEEWKS